MKSDDSYRDKGARRLLVKELRAKGIVDEHVLDALMSVPRHLFIHKDFRFHAYQDKAFPIGEGQTISQPYTVAYQTQLLHIQPGDKVLEIGTGSGYQAAILIQMGAQLTTIERQEKLFDKTTKLLRSLHYEAHFILGDGSLGYEQDAPYDKIIVTAGAPRVPEALLQQLRTGGMLIIPVGNNQVQTMHILIKKTDGSIEDIQLDQFRFVPLIGTQAW